MENLLNLTPLPDSHPTHNIRVLGWVSGVGKVHSLHPTHHPPHPAYFSIVCGAMYRTDFSSAKAASLSIGTRPITSFALFGSSITSNPSSFSLTKVSSDLSVSQI